MREIKFRGTPIYWKNFVYWSLIQCEIMLWDDDLSGKARVKILYKIKDKNGTEYEVLKETVGQYTWLKDKNGTEIYEGDIVNQFESTGIVLFWEANVNPDDMWNVTRIVWFYIKYNNWVIEDIYSPILEILWNIYEDKHLLDK